MRYPSNLQLLAAVICHGVVRAAPTKMMLLHRLAQEQETVAAAAADSAAGTNNTEPAEPTTCDEGIDNDEALAANPMAATYGLTTCAGTYETLVAWSGSADLLCKSLGAGLCNCTCAGMEFEPSIKVDAVPFAETVDYTPEIDGHFDCEHIRKNEGDKKSTLLPSYVHDWQCSELGEVGVVLWQADEAAGTIAFAVEFISDGGGAGIGVSSNGGMYGADLLVVRKQAISEVARTGGDRSEWVLDDMFSKGYSEDGSLVTKDPIQDGKLEFVNEEDGNLAFIVSRPISSCDDMHDLEILSGPMPFIWARFSDHGHIYHGPEGHHRGALYLNLVEPNARTAVAIPEAEDQLFTVDLRFIDEDNQRYTLPNGQVNTYACKSFELPTDQPYHIVSYEAVLDGVDQAADVVHHIVMYSCEEDAMSPEATECGSMSSMCQHIEIAWAVGMPPQLLPAEAGIPLKKYVLLEMHYENLSKQENVQDGSGLRLTFTPQLRRHDFGYMIIGVDLGRTPALEPGLVSVARTGYCSADCLARHLPEDGVQVHGQFFHSHLQGRALHTQHYRGGKELPHLGDMPYYDFNHQYFKYYGKEPRLMPGDSLMTTCIFDTSDKADNTTFGLETTEEMCFNVVGHYPLIDLQFCWNETENGGYCTGKNGYDDGGFIESPLPDATPYTDDTSENCISGYGKKPTLEEASEKPSSTSSAGQRHIWFAVVLLVISCGV